MKIPSTYSKIFLTAACVALLSACGGASEEQDALPPTSEAPPVNNQVPVNGVALNGYLANAIVWIDARENNTPDGFESVAYTDNQGYFSYNPNTGVNYCASSEASLQRFCLQTGAQSGNLVIKVAKGMELMTGIPFRSVLTANISIEKARANLSAATSLGPRPEGDIQLWQEQLDASQLTLSSMSTIAHYLGKLGKDNVSMRDALNNMGFNLSPNLSNTDIINMDFIARSIEGDSDANALFLADSAISRMIDVMTVNMEEAAKDIEFGLNGFALSAADSVYSALANNIDTYGQSSSSQVPSLSSNAIGSSSLNAKTMASNQDFSFVFGISILTNAIDNLFSTMSSLDLSSNIAQQRLGQIANNNNLFELTGNVLKVAQALTDVVKDIGKEKHLARLKTISHALVIPTISEPVAFAEIRELMAIMTVSKLFSYEYSGQPEIYIDFVADVVAPEANETAFLTAQTDLQSFAKELHDFVKYGLSDLSSTIEFPELGIDDTITDQTADTLSEELDNILIDQLANLSNDNGTSPWANKSLSLSGSKDNTQEGQIVAFFTQQSSSSSASADTGELIMCVAYNDLEDTSANVTGKRFEGTWSVLNAEAQSSMSLLAEGVTVQMSVLGETNGRDIPEDQQALNSTRNPNEAYGKFKFRLNEEEATWHSDHASINSDYGIQDVSSIPQNDEQCRAILNLGS